MSLYELTSGKIALSASSTKSLWLLNPFSPNTTIIGIDVSMDANAPETAVQFDLYKVAALGSPTGTSVSPATMDDTDAVGAGTLALVNLTAEPTTVTPIKSWLIQPCGGLLPFLLPLGREYKLKSGGARWGLRAVTPSGVAPNVISNVQILE